MNVKEIITDYLKDYLKKNGYDGLMSVRIDCVCRLDNIAPCGNIQLDCSVGYNTPCDFDCTHGRDGFHIKENKPKENKND